MQGRHKKETGSSGLAETGIFRPKAEIEQRLIKAVFGILSACITTVSRDVTYSGVASFSSNTGHHLSMIKHSSRGKTEFYSFCSRPFLRELSYT